MENKHALEQEVLEDYRKKFNVLTAICYELHVADLEKEYSDIYELAIKKAAGCKLMIDYMENNNVMGTN